MILPETRVTIWFVAKANFHLLSCVHTRTRTPTAQRLRRQSNRVLEGFQKRDRAHPYGATFSGVMEQREAKPHRSKLSTGSVKCINKHTHFRKASVKRGLFGRNNEKENHINAKITQRHRLRVLNVSYDNIH